MSEIDPQQRRPLAERPGRAVDARRSNAEMADTILAMPVQPYRDGTYAVRVAVIRGRRTGVAHHVPIAVIQRRGRRYLVSPDRRRPWALNLAASGACEILSADGAEAYRATDADPQTATAVLRLYLEQLAWASEQFPFSAGDPDEVITERLDQVAVFTLQPA